MESHAKVNRKNFEVYLKIFDKKIAFEVYDDYHYLKNKRKLKNIVAIFIKGNPH